VAGMNCTAARETAHSSAMMMASCEHSLVDDQAFMYLWNESVASRGPDEIASALLNNTEHNAYKSKE